MSFRMCTGPGTSLEFLCRRWLGIQKIPSLHREDARLIYMMGEGAYHIPQFSAHPGIKYKPKIMLSLEKILMQGKTEGKKRRGWQRVRWLDNITDLMYMNLNRLWEIVEDRGAWQAPQGHKESDVT